MNKKIHVVLSGGSGSRLWPLSKKSRTKQYIPLFDGKNLFEMTLKTNRAYCDEVLVVANADNYELSLKALANNTDLPHHIIVEAMPKNTAAAIAFAALAAHEEDLLLVTPSDHIIGDTSTYEQAIENAFTGAAQNYLMTIGIQPTKVETGYGYIQHQETEVLAFHEKPNYENAKAFMKAGNFLWNSGIFCFKAKIYLEELQQYRPDILQACKKVMQIKHNEFLDAQASEQIPSESIDFAIMEKSKNVKVVKGLFEWSDLGSFEALYEYFLEKGMYVKETNLVISENAHVELHGLQNTMVIQSGESILVMPIKDSQEVKKIYEKLQKTNSKLIE